MLVQWKLSAQRAVSRIASATAEFSADECGGTAIEYSLLATLISVACIGAMKGLGGSMTNTWNSVSNAIGNSMK